MAVSTPISTQLRVRYVTGTSASGTTLSKTMNLFPTAKVRESLDSSGVDAALVVASLLSPLMLLAYADLEMVAQSTISES